MELKSKEEMRNEILQSWLRSAWVYPVRGPENRLFLRLTPGGRLKMRKKIGELERTLEVKGEELVKQEQEGSMPLDRDRLELVMMVQAYTSERRLIESQGLSLGTPVVSLEEDEEGGGEDA